MLGFVSERKPRTPKYTSLADYFQKTGRTQVDVGREVGVPQNVLSQILNGRGCSLRTAIKLHERLGIPYQSMVGRSRAERTEFHKLKARLRDAFRDGQDIADVIQSSRE